MKRMHTKEEITEIAHDEAGKLDKVIPTDIKAKSNGAIYLTHDGEDIGSTPLSFKQLFGKHILTGEGNIDLYYHSISITNDGFIWSGSIISSNALPINSFQDLFTVCADKILSGYGYYDSVDGAYSVGCLILRKDINNSYFDRAPRLSFKLSEVASDASTTIEDKITTI